LGTFFCGLLFVGGASGDAKAGLGTVVGGTIGCVEGVEGCAGVVGGLGAEVVGVAGVGVGIGVGAAGVGALLILELIAFNCWLNVGWQGAKSYPALT